MRTGGYWSTSRPDSWGYPRSTFTWPLTPEVLYWMPIFLHERYRIPIAITENGVACHDWVSLDGKVYDPQRQDYLHRHLLELRKAIGEGVPVCAYFAWTFMDNFEWNNGYHQRFGLTHVDFGTLERILKESARWYGRVIAANGENL